MGRHISTNIQQRVSEEEVDIWEKNGQSVERGTNKIESEGYTVLLDLKLEVHKAIQEKGQPETNNNDNGQGWA